MLNIFYNGDYMFFKKIALIIICVFIALLTLNIKNRHDLYNNKFSDEINPITTSFWNDNNQKERAKAIKAQKPLLK